MEQECTALVADFAKHIRTGLPFVTLKAAVTLDGKIATRTGDSKWITGEEARSEAHRMRGESDAILIGVGTVLADDPKLTVRHVEGADPVRVVLDADLRTPPQRRFARPGERIGRRYVLIFHAHDVDAARREALRGPKRRAGRRLPTRPRGRHRGSLEGAWGAETWSEYWSKAARTCTARSWISVWRTALQSSSPLVSSATPMRFPLPPALGSNRSSAPGIWCALECKTLGPDWLVTGDFERMQ